MSLWKVLVLCVAWLFLNAAERLIKMIGYYDHAVEKGFLPPISASNPPKPGEWE